MRELVLGAMPEGAVPATHIASGPWCFSGREKLFPGWDGSLGKENEFPLFPDPFPYGAAADAPDSIDTAARTANTETLRLIQVFGDRLNIRFSVACSGTFWTMALGPWLLLATHMLVERQKRVLDMVERLGGEPLLVRILPKNCPFSFSTLQRFMLYGVQDRNFNHYVFSRILEAVAPLHWTLQELPPLSLGDAGIAGETPLSTRGLAPGLAERGRQALRRRARLLPFPLQKGFGPGKSLLYSLAVLAGGRKKSRAIDFSIYAGSACSPCSWIFDAEKLIFAAMPTAIADREALPVIPDAAGKLRGMTAAVSQDDEYRLAMAAWLEGGGRLFSVQHGANYGNLRVMGGTVFEYMQHAFITWGWTRHEGYAVNAVPLPQPGLFPGKPKSAGNGKSAPGRSAPLLLVGTEMSPYSYRLKSRPLAAAQVKYRKDKVRFLWALPPSLLANTLYRPYFPVRSGLDDAAYLQNTLPELALCTGDLSRHLSACRLVVLDHYGTTLLTALAADIPVLCFWDRAAWAMDPESDQAVGLLEQAGIWHSGPQEAAHAAARIWDDVAAWWKSPDVVEAKNYWAHHYALAQRNRKGVLTWLKTLASL